MLPSLTNLHANTAVQMICTGVDRTQRLSAAVSHPAARARRFLDSGGVYKLAFGPKAFIVVSDPVVVRHLLKARRRASPPKAGGDPIEQGFSNGASRLWGHAPRPDNAGKSERGGAGGTPGAVARKGLSARSGLQAMAGIYDKGVPAAAPQPRSGRASLNLRLTLSCPQENAGNYDKGVLAEILEPIMGKGLIPADLDTWKPRRRAIVPAFHRAWLGAMVAMFNACTRQTVDKLERALAAGGEVRAPQLPRVLPGP